MNRLLLQSSRTYSLFLNNVKNRQVLHKSKRCLSDTTKDKNETSGETTPEDDKFDYLIPKLSGFAQAYEKQTEALQEKKPEEVPQTFAALLRNSPFIDVSREF